MIVSVDFTLTRRYLSRDDHSRTAAHPATTPCSPHPSTNTRRCRSPRSSTFHTFLPLLTLPRLRAVQPFRQTRWCQGEPRSASSLPQLAPPRRRAAAPPRRTHAKTDLSLLPTPAPRRRNSAQYARAARPSTRPSRRSSRSAAEVCGGGLPPTHTTRRLHTHFWIEQGGSGAPPLLPPPHIAHSHIVLAPLSSLPMQLHPAPRSLESLLRRRAPAPKHAPLRALPL